MSELEQIAASVAKALGLVQSDGFGRAYVEDKEHPLRGPFIQSDGMNIFAIYWQIRCRDWLLEHGYLIKATSSNGVIARLGGPSIPLTCPASEFCARAIHALSEH